MRRSLPISQPPAGRQDAAIEVVLTPGGWDYAADPYPTPDRLDDRHYGQEIPEADWEVWYGAEALPEESDPAWDATNEGECPAVASGGVLSAENELGASGWLYYLLGGLELDSELGTVLEAHLRVNSDSADENQGVALVICDGLYEYVAWLRADGVNLDGEADVPVDMTAFVDVKLEARDGVCRLSVAEERLQASGYVCDSESLQVVFGTWTPLFGPSSSSSSDSELAERIPASVSFDLDWLRCRAMLPSETMPAA